MFWVSLILILAGGVNFLQAKNETYWGLNARMWISLYGESATQKIFYVQGIMSIIAGILVFIVAL